MWLLKLLKWLFTNSQDLPESHRPDFEFNRTTKTGMLRAKSGQEGPYEGLGADKLIFQVQNITKNAQKVYFYLSCIADKDGFCFPFHKTIALRTNLSESTVSKAIMELEDIQLVTHQRRVSRRGGSSNLYHVKRVAEVFPDANDI